MVGDSGNDVVYGNLGHDTLEGDAGSDFMYGGQGNDRIINLFNTDVDRQFGNLGADTFVFINANPSGQHEVDADRVMDFSEGQGDRVDLAVTGGPVYTEISNPIVNSVDQAVQLSNDLGLWATNNVVFVAGGTNGYLLVDPGNNSAAFGDAVDDFAVVLQGLNSLALFQASDLV